MAQSTDRGFGEHSLMTEKRIGFRYVVFRRESGGRFKARAKIISTFVINKTCLPYTTDNGFRVILL